MKQIYRQSQLFTFLLYTEGKGLEKKILDCGAGGNCPPLGIFKNYGYETHGVDCSENALKRAAEFEKKHDLNLNIIEGDMRNLTFKDEEFSYAYSYNSIFHMSKEEIKSSIKEIHRVLAKGGYAFINFASCNDERSTLGKKVREGEYLQFEHGEDILHSYFDINEAEDNGFFEGFEVIYKENRIRNGIRQNGDKIALGFIDYIIEKK